MYLLVRKDHPRPGEEVNEYPLDPIQPAKDEVTFSVIEIPKPRDQPPPPKENRDKIKVKFKRLYAQQHQCISNFDL